MEEIQVTLLANAGVLVTFGGYQIAIDAFQEKDEHPFSAMPDWVRHGMTDEGGALRDIDFLLFTHSHTDHFHKEAVLRYLMENKVQGVFLPRDEKGEWVRGACPKEGIWIEKPEERLTPAIFFEAFPTVHMGEAFREKVHDAILLTLGERTLLFTSDAEPSYENFAGIEGMEIDTVFVNPLFFQSAKGRALLREMGPNHVVSYHISFDGEDAYGHRVMSERNRKRYGADFPMLTILQEEKQSIIL